MTTSCGSASVAVSDNNTLCSGLDDLIEAFLLVACAWWPAGCSAILWVAVKQVNSSAGMHLMAQKLSALSCLAECGWTFSTQHLT